MSKPAESETLNSVAIAGGTVTLPRNYGLDILRIVSICGVVAIHVFGLRVGANPKSGTTWWIATTIDIAAIWVVPVFIMISGALLLGSRQVAEKPMEFYRKRATRIIPALIVWNLVYIVGVRIWMRHETLPTGRVLQMLYDSSVFTQLYFLCIVLGLYAVAPVLSTFLRSGGQGRSWATAGVLVGVTTLAYMLPGILGHYGVSRSVGLNFLTMWIPYVGYFVAGHALRNVRLKGLGLLAAAVLTCALTAFTVWHYGNRNVLPLVDIFVNESYFGLLVSLMAFGIFVIALSLMEGVNVPRRTGAILRALSNATFGVFLVHLVFFEAIRLNVPSVSTENSLRELTVAYVVTLAASFAVALAGLRVPLLRRIF